MNGSFDFADMRAAASRLIDTWSPNEPGGAVIGFDASGIRFEVAGGVSDLSRGTPFNAASVVRLASNTKHIFAAMLMARGYIALEDQLSTHLSDLNATIGAVSVAQALSMTGGLCDLREVTALQGVPLNAAFDVESAHAQVRAMDTLNFEPGTEYSYSNTGYRLVETAAERKGTRFSDFVARDIRAALGVAFHAPDIWGQMVPGLVPGYWLSQAGWLPGDQGMPLSASGCVCGSARALAAWLRHLVAGTGWLDGIFGKLTNHVTTAHGVPTDYGLGVFRMRAKDRVFVGHGGALPGYRTAFLVDAASACGVVVTSNRDDTAAGAIARSVLYAGLAIEPPRPVSSGWARPGLYVDHAGTRWVEVRQQSIVHMGAEEALFELDGRAVSLNATAPMSLASIDGRLSGHIGFAPVELRPAVGATDAPGEGLDGRWRIDGVGAGLEIRDGAVIQGIGPQRKTMRLQPLDRDRWLFTRNDGPWPSRICLQRMSSGRIQLSTARARAVIYERVECGPR